MASKQTEGRRKNWEITDASSKAHEQDTVLCHSFSDASQHQWRLSAMSSRSGNWVLWVADVPCCCKALIPVRPMQMQPGQH